MLGSMEDDLASPASGAAAAAGAGSEAALVGAFAAICDGGCWHRLNYDWREALFNPQRATTALTCGRPGAGDAAE